MNFLECRTPIKEYQYFSLKGSYLLQQSFVKQPFPPSHQASHNKKHHLYLPPEKLRFYHKPVGIFLIIFIILLSLVISGYLYFLYANTPKDLYVKVENISGEDLFIKVKVDGKEIVNDSLLDSEEVKYKAEGFKTKEKHKITIDFGESLFLGFAANFSSYENVKIIIYWDNIVLFSEF